MPEQLTAECQQIALGAQLVMARFGTTLDGTRCDLDPQAAHFVSEHLGAERLDANNWPALPYQDYVLGVVDRPDHAAAKSRYILHWEAPLPNTSELVIDQVSLLMRARIRLGAKQNGVWRADLISYSKSAYSPEPVVSEQIGNLSRFMRLLRWQSMASDRSNHRNLHHISNRPGIDDMASMRSLEQRSRFVQLPASLLQVELLHPTHL